MTSTVDFRAAEELLSTAEFEELQPVWHSSNYVYLASLRGPAGETLAAIYKPQRGERPLWDFPEGTLHLREVAAYRLSLVLGWPFIPPTVLRDGPGGEGSLQLFVEHDPNRHFFEQREEPALVPQLQRIALFDYVANNADRKGGHCLLDADGRIWAIDHGLCFHAQYKLRSVIWDWAGEPAIPSRRSRRYQPRLAAVKSMPAKSDANDTPSICTCRSSPESAGSWKVPASRRLPSTHHPEPSNHNALARRRRLLRNR